MRFGMYYRILRECYGLEIYVSSSGLTRNAMECQIVSRTLRRTTSRYIFLPKNLAFLVTKTLEVTVVVEVVGNQLAIL